MPTATATNTIHLLPAQDRFLFSPKKFTAFVAGVGSGKTWAGALKTIMHCCPGQDGLVAAPTYPMLRDATQRTLFDLLNHGDIPYTHYKSEERADIGGSNVFFRSADQPERLRGLNLAWAYLDEAAMMRELVWRIVLGRLRVGEPRAWITTTPAGFNWVYHYWQEQQRDDYEMVHASSRENTYLPDEYVRDLERTYTGEFAKQEIDGDFVAFEGLVYSEFSRSLHVVEPFAIPASWQRVRAIDFGFVNPFVCIWGALDEDKRLYIYDEHYRTQTLMAEHAAAIKRRPGTFAWTVADHDAQDNAELIAQGILTRNAHKEVTRGIQKMKARLVPQADGRPRLFVFSSCANTVRELGTYRWPEEQSGKPEKEEPRKENDHAMDALRYMVREVDGGSFILV